MSCWIELARAIRSHCPGMELREEEPMSRHTTFRIGGPARLMAFPKTVVEVQKLLILAKEWGVVPSLVGNGSDLLVADEGIDGLVIKSEGMTEVTVSGSQIVASSGVLLPALANLAREHSLSGLEFAQGIPGSLGGAISMNAGAYGGEMADVITQVEYLDEQGQIVTRSGAELELSYRHSFFTGKDCFILGATLELQPGDGQTIREKMEDCANRRREKQPLQQPSAGSTFKRPPGQFAAALIDQCGLRGRRVGDAQVSEKHAGFLVNLGKATCRDMLALICEVQEEVKRQKGVELELEVKVLGTTNQAQKSEGEIG